MKISFTELNMYEVENFHKKVLKDLEKVKSSFTLNFTDVTKIDLNNIQLLLSIKKYCDEKNIDLKITNVNAKQVKQTFKMFEIEKLIGVEL